MNITKKTKIVVGSAVGYRCNHIAHETTLKQECLCWELALYKSSISSCVRPVTEEICSRGILIPKRFLAMM